MIWNTMLILKKWKNWDLQSILSLFPQLVFACIMHLACKLWEGERFLPLQTFQVFLCLLPSKLFLLQASRFFPQILPISFSSHSRMQRFSLVIHEVRFRVWVPICKVIGVENLNSDICNRFCGLYLKAQNRNKTI